MPVTVGVLGAGIIAKSFMEAAPDVPDLEVAVICDVVEEAARAMAEPHSIAWVTDYRDVLTRGYKPFMWRCPTICMKRSQSLPPAPANISCWKNR